MRVLCYERFFKIWIYFIRSSVIQTWMNSFAVIPSFNKFKNCIICIFEILVFFQVHFFFFQNWMKRFNTRIIIRTAFSTISLLDIFLFLLSCYFLSLRIICSIFYVYYFILTVFYRKARDTNGSGAVDRSEPFGRGRTMKRMLNPEQPGFCVSKNAPIKLQLHLKTLKILKFLSKTVLIFFMEFI
jgi:hypothetical protein